MQIPPFKSSKSKDKELNKIDEVFEETSSFFAKTESKLHVKTIERSSVPTSEGNFSLFQKSNPKPDSKNIDIHQIDSIFNKKPIEEKVESIGDLKKIW
jgi:hypothetical protein